MTDMHTAALMADHFDKIQKLPNPIEGVPNWRCVPGYQVDPQIIQLQMTTVHRNPLNQQFKY